MGLQNLGASMLAADYPGPAVMLGFTALLIAIIWAGGVYFKKGLDKDQETRKRFKAQIEADSKSTE